MQTRQWMVLGALAMLVAAPLTGCGDNDNDETVFLDCGNGVVDSGEQCDDGNSIETDACLSTCRDAQCGDGFIETSAEQCDGSNLNGASCSNLGLGSGTLLCSGSCEFDTSGCGAGPVPTFTATPNAQPTPTATDGGGNATPTTEPSDGAPTPTPTATTGGPACSGNVVVDVDVAVNGQPIPIGGIQFQVSYPAAVRIPGTLGDPSVAEAVELPPGLPAVNDEDTNADQVDDRLAVSWVSSGTGVSGTIATVTFECSPGASEPSAGDFACNVVSASDETAQDIQGATCTVAVQ